MTSKYDRNEYGKRKPITDIQKRAMTEYYEAGLNAGSTSDDLLSELAQLCERSDRQVQRYISQIRSKKRSGATHVSTTLTIHMTDIQRYLKDCLERLREKTLRTDLDFWQIESRYSLGMPYKKTLGIALDDSLGIEHDRLFPNMLEHCLTVARKYKIFQVKANEYQRARHPIYILLVSPIMDKFEGKIGQVLDEGDFRITEEPDIIVDSFLQDCDPCLHIFVPYEDGQEKRSISECREYYKHIIKSNPRLMTCKNNARRAFEEVNTARIDVQDAIDTSLKSCEYLNHRCQSCPTDV